VTVRAPIPFTVIGGFLGAGKTTLLNRVLHESRGVRYAVLVNDFGDLNVDAGLVAAHDGETIALANGCLCCSIGDSLVDTLLGLMERAQAVDHIVVEASGIADPKRIGDIARIDPALAYDGIIVLADAAAVRAHAADGRIGDTIMRQLAVADLVVVNKVDRVGEAQLAELERWLATAAPHAPRLRACRGELPLSVLLGRGAGAPLATGAQPPAAPAHEQQYRRALLAACGPIRREVLARFLDALPPSVLRVKGMLRIDGEADPMLLQRVGRSWELSTWPRQTRPEPGLVFIGTVAMPGGEALRLRLARAAHRAGEDVPRAGEQATTTEGGRSR